MLVNMNVPPRYLFPGMDPWLESPAVWAGVHDRLIVYLADELNSAIAPAYIAVPGGRLVVEEPRRGIYPDVIVTQSHPEHRAMSSAVAVEEPIVVRIADEPRRQTFIEIRDTRAGNRVVTVVEILSPSNKEAGQDARNQYLRKQEELLASDINLVEIDLLRGGLPTVALPAPRSLPGPYRIVIRRAGVRDQAEVYDRSLPQRLPRFRLPLRAPDADTAADMQALLERVYREGRYGDLIDHAQPPEPPLAPDEEAWAREVLETAG